MGILQKLLNLFRKQKDIETARRLQASGVSAAPYPAGVRPGIAADTRAEVREKDETVNRLRETVQKRHEVVRARLKAM